MMGLIQRFGRLQFDRKRRFDQPADDIFAGGDAIVHDGQPMKLCDAGPRITRFMGQRVLENLFQESRPERVADGEGVADRRPRQFIQPDLICVHWRHRRLICVRFFFHDPTAFFGSRIISSNNHAGTVAAINNT